MPVVTDTAIAIFIVYANEDVHLAEALKELLEAWGLKAFYCRQETREHAASKGYRSYLRKELKRSNFVIFLLSSAFRYSQYCQIEAGMTAMRKKKPYLEITIPPTTFDDIRKVSPILEGRDAINADSEGLSLKLKETLESCFLNLRIKDDEDEKVAHAIADLRKRIGERIDDYKLKPPRQELIGVWPSLQEKSGAPYSIIQSIRRSIERGSTHLAFVGVSLKFSLKLITEALRDLPKDNPANRKKLTIDLVYMDDQSHILHSLSDTVDIDNVIENFHRSWPETRKGWEESCKAAGIELDVNKPLGPKGIDYIPPQVGILIDSGNAGCKLYAGRCSFEQIGKAFRLMVGERDYFFYTSDNDLGREAIRVFIQHLNCYRDPKHNGVSLVPDHSTWSRQLESCIENYADIHEVTLISNTTTKFYPLILASFRKGHVVKVYTHGLPNDLPSEDQSHVEGLKHRLEGDVRNEGNRNTNGRVELRYYYHQPTFRAALIGDAVLGIEMYLLRTDAKECRELGSTREQPMTTPVAAKLVPSGMRLIATSHSSHFTMLKRDLIDRFFRCGPVDEDPYHVVRTPEPLAKPASTP